MRFRKTRFLSNESIYPILAGFSVFAIYYWLAFRCVGYDWAVSEMFGEVVSTAAKQGGGFPYFSYFYNGGVYLAHDPQAWVTSPLFNIFVLLTDEIAGARWLGIAYGVLGYFSTYAWLKTRFSRSASVFGALALSLSLGMFWRMVAGHMLFLLQMILPFFLLAIVQIEKAPSAGKKAVWIISMALAGAWAIYEPGFHALFYFIIPGILIEIFLRFLFRAKDSFRLLLPLVSVGALSILMILPKILSWTALSMSRAPDATDGTLALKDVLSALFITARAAVMGYHVPGSNPERWHFIFEVNTALMPVASLMALFGIYAGIKRKWYRETQYCLAAGCLFFSVLVASNQPFWEFIQSLTAGGIRVPSRYIALGSFGLVIFSVYGIDALLFRFRKQEKVIAIAGCALIFIFAGNWLHRAQKIGTLRTSPIVLNTKEPKESRFVIGKYCPVGSGCLNTYQEGYADDPYIQYLKENQITEENLRFHLPKNLDVKATSLTLTSLKAGETVEVPLRFASFGHRISTVPVGLSPVVEVFQGHLRIHGDPRDDAERVEIRPALLFPVWSVWVAAVTALISFVLLGILHSRKLTLRGSRAQQGARSSLWA